MGDRGEAAGADVAFRPLSPARTHRTGMATTNTRRRTVGSYSSGPRHRLLRPPGLLGRDQPDLCACGAWPDIQPGGESAGWAPQRMQVVEARADEFGDVVDPGPFCDAAHLFRRLPASSARTVLLHGDFHCRSLLLSGRARLAIDLPRRPAIRRTTCRCSSSTTCTSTTHTAALRPHCCDTDPLEWPRLGARGEARIALPVMTCWPAQLFDGPVPDPMEPGRGRSPRSCKSPSPNLA